MANTYNCGNCLCISGVQADAGTGSPPIPVGIDGDGIIHVPPSYNSDEVLSGNGVPTGPPADVSQEYLWADNIVNQITHWWNPVLGQWVPLNTIGTLCNQMTAYPTANLTIENGDEIIVIRNGQCTRVSYQDIAGCINVIASNGISVSAGASSNSLVFSLQVSDDIGNAFEIRADGIYVPDQCTQLAAKPSSGSYEQIDDEVLVIRDGQCIKVKLNANTGGGGGGAVNQVTGTNGISVSPTTGNVVVSAQFAPTQPTSTSGAGGQNMTTLIGGQIYTPSCVPRVMGRGNVLLVTDEGCQYRAPKPIRYVQTSNQPILGAGETILNFNSLVFDSDGLVSTGSAWAYTCPVRGVYRVDAYVTCENWGGSMSFDPKPNFAVHVKKNGSYYGVLGQYNNDVANSEPEFYQTGGSDMVHANAGDTIQVVTLTSITNLGNINTFNLSPYTFNRVSIDYVGDY